MYIYGIHYIILYHIYVRKLDEIFYGKFKFACTEGAEMAKSKTEIKKFGSWQVYELLRGLQLPIYEGTGKILNEMEIGLKANHEGTREF